MKNANTIIPCYAADTSGVCSALYELGGMTVVHDASGCNSTYSTHDEPRWYDMDSMIYISALTEIDAIMGNNERIIGDTVAAAADMKPQFIAVCGSPMPMMTGVDFDAIAEEIEERSGIRTFGLHTNGTRSYIEGAAESFEAIAREYVSDCAKADGIGVNVLGLTPLDYGVNGTPESIREWLETFGMKQISSFAMGSALNDIKRAGSARVNLVVSISGWQAARYMWEQFRIPYVCGVPIGLKFSRQLAAALERAAEEGKPIGAFDRSAVGNEKCDVVIGEGIFAASLANAIACEQGKAAKVIAPLMSENCDNILADGDLCIYAEEDIKSALSEISPENVIADPLYKYIVPDGSRQIPLPHFAFSGRCYERFMPNMIYKMSRSFFL